MAGSIGCPCSHPFARLVTRRSGPPSYATQVLICVFEIVAGDSNWIWLEGPTTMSRRPKEDTEPVAYLPLDHPPHSAAPRAAPSTCRSRGLPKSRARKCGLPCPWRSSTARIPVLPCCSPSRLSISTPPRGVGTRLINEEGARGGARARGGCEGASEGALLRAGILRAARARTSAVFWGGGGCL